MTSSTAIILNWNTLNVSKDSLRRLRKEVPVIFVDNGSTDGTREYYKDKSFDNVEFLFLDKNLGNCVSRNLAIKKVKTKYYFLLDGDILYVPMSISVLESILGVNERAGIAGVHNIESVRRYGFNGTNNLYEASIRAEEPKRVLKGFPMAWTQYGLFRNNGQLFPEFPPFDTAGMGYEDSWFYHEMKEKGLESYFIESPLYYHEAHAGFRELEKVKLPSREQERKQAFEDRFGKVDWLDKNYKVSEV